MVTLSSQIAQGGVNAIDEGTFKLVRLKKLFVKIAESEKVLQEVNPSPEVTKETPTQRANWLAEEHQHDRNPKANGPVEEPLPGIPHSGSAEHAGEWAVETGPDAL